MEKAIISYMHLPNATALGGDWLCVYVAVRKQNTAVEDQQVGLYGEKDGPKGQKTYDDDIK